ncbi:Fic family protein [Deinococcus ruber]|uniref:Fic family protein n=1 Tax=Deinococcus ruber TaxID=1848197 RepID=UPI00166EE457|nr:Fic family protein [Deinococcus ruber]
MFRPDEVQRLQQALFLLTSGIVQVPAPALTRTLLLDWHTTLSAGLSSMQPGILRRGDITFGSYYGTVPSLINTEIADLIERVNTSISELLVEAEVGLKINPADVIDIGVLLHAELIRIHPFEDGNGRLARAAHTWVHALFNLPIPVWIPGTPYYDALASAIRFRRYAAMQDYVLRCMGR